MKFQEALKGFLAAAQKIQDASYGKQASPLVAEEGPKYVRIVSTVCQVRSAFCFVDKSNGNVLKPASWKGPVKHNPRSNIYDADFGAKGITAYGTVYLR